jgi:tRNA(Leu) C34 or U34 (ribose-2'-O)-methylase TrmL
MQNLVVVPEGARVRDIVKTIVSKTDISKGAVTAALAKPEAIGLPPEAEGNPEGYLFPATYTVPPKQDALGLITQDRHAPPESGALARSASGALEIVPWVRVVNLARALDEIGEAGFWRIGLTGSAPRLLGDAIAGARVALVLGAEGEGMRQNTEAHCDELAKLPISPRVESLNVSNAAAIALYAVATRA